MVQPVNDGSRIGVLRDSRIKPEISLNPGSDGSSHIISRERLPFVRENPCVGFNGFVLDFQRGCLLSQDKEIALRPKTYEVLSYLVRNNGRLVPKDELMKAIWPNVIVTDDSLFQCIAELRRALGDEKQHLIKTVQRRGYRFEADCLRPPEATAPPDIDISRAAEAVTESLPEKSRRSAEPIRIASIGAVAVILILSAAYAIDRWWPGMGMRPVSGTPVSLLVLPFRSLSGDPQSDNFAAGVTVELTTDLSRLSGATVISPATAYTLKDQSVDIRQIGRDLNVRYVVQGTVARSGKDIRINIQLVETATGRHVWADRVVHETGQSPSWQDEVAGGIASALNSKLTRLESERALRERPRNPEAYDLVTTGWALVYTAKKPENYRSAQALFSEALVRDPGAVNALAGIGWVSALSVLNGWSNSIEADLSTAKRTSDQLLAIDPNHVVAHHVRGASLRMEKNTEAARDAFLTAVSLNPNFANSHNQLGATYIELGHPEEAIRSIEKAMRLSPRDPNVGHWMANMGIAHMHLERYPDAVTWLSRSHNIGTSSPALLHRAYLVAALALAGRADDARAALAELQRIKPDVTVTGLRKIGRSTNPRFLEQRQRLYDGLRLAGLPE